MNTKPIKQLIDKIGVGGLAKEFEVSKTTVYYWRNREAGAAKKRGNGISRDKIPQFLKLAKAHKIKGLTVEYLSGF